VIIYKIHWLQPFIQEIRIPARHLFSPDFPKITILNKIQGDIQYQINYFYFLVEALPLEKTGYDKIAG